MAEDGKRKIRIAGEKKVSDWIILRNNITKDFDKSDFWEEAYNNFLKHRIDTRYMKPIEELLKMKKHQGEGFAIVTLLCSLIEFLEALYHGKVYKHANRIQKIKNIFKKNNYEYCDDRSMFVSFLRNRSPFKDSFNKNNANKFYSYVRCGLIHEAYTKEAWVIRIGNEKNT